MYMALRPLPAFGHLLTQGGGIGGKLAVISKFNIHRQILCLFESFYTLLSFIELDRLCAVIFYRNFFFLYS